MTAQSLGAVAANVAAISAQVAALQLKSSQKDAATAAAHEEILSLLHGLGGKNQQQQVKQQQPKQKEHTQQPQSKPQPQQQLQQQAQLQPPLSPQQQWQQSRQQLPLLQTLQQHTSTHIDENSHSVMDVGGPWAHPWFRSHTDASAPATDGRCSSGSNTADPAIPNPILYVEPNSLEELFLDVNNSTVPTTFDLGGQTLYHQMSALPDTSSVVFASNVTIRNGTLHQSDFADKDGPGLHVQGVNVRLEDLRLIGGGWGVLVLPGGSVNMRSCSVYAPYIGLGVGNFGSMSTVGIAKMEAQDVKVFGCGFSGISVGRAGQARVHACDFTDGENYGMFVGGDCTSMLMATDVCCSANQKQGLFVGLQGKAMLKRCKLTGNGSGCVCVQDAQSMVQLAQCTRDANADAINGGTMSWVT